MNAVPDLTPPGKNGKSEKPAKAPKAEKVPKVEGAPAAPAEPKGPRAPRQDYGFRPDATIGIAKDKDVSKVRGQRKSWYDKIVAYDGKKVSEFLEANKDNPKDPPRGWVRFFAQEGFITLTGGTVPAPKPAKEEKAPETPPAA